MAKQPSCERVLMTPEVATKWFEANRHNRPMSAFRVRQYQEQMERGLWTESNDAIVFDVDGNLLNGQHRIKACIDSGKNVWMMVVRGAPTESFKHIDTHGKRSFGDVLSVRGEINTIGLAASARLLIAYERGDVRVSRGRARESTEGGIIAIEDIEACIDANPGLRDSVAFVKSHRFQKGWIESSSAIVLHYLFSKLDADAAKKFFLDLRDGGCEKDDPVHLLRERIMSCMASGMRIGQAEKFGWLIRAWNHRRAGNKLSRFARGKRTEDDTIEIPKIK